MTLSLSLLYLSRPLPPPHVPLSPPLPFFSLSLPGDILILQLICCDWNVVPERSLAWSLCVCLCVYLCVSLCVSECVCVCVCVSLYPCTLVCEFSCATAQV